MIQRDPSATTPTATGSASSALRRSAAIILTLAAFALLSLPGLNTLPLDKHEGLVLQTAREMHARGDLIVPWFNDQPRLNKPPVNYWATLAVAWVRGGGSIDPPRLLDARIPSVLAMLGCLLLIPLLAHRLASSGSDPDRDPGVGWLAAALFTVSPAVAFFAQDARPDPLYALFCVAGIACLLPERLLADRLRPDHAPTFPTRLRALAGWALFALATLTKGPHIPLFLLLALTIAVLVAPIPVPGTRGTVWRDAVRTIHPAAGLIVYVLLTLPWWWALQLQLGSDTIQQSQLGGALYQPTWHGVAQAYREPAGLLLLLLPWSFIPLIFWRHSRHLWRTTPGFRCLTLLCLVPLALLLISPQHRWHYTLPLTPLYAVLCSMVLVDWLRARSRSAQRPARAALVVVCLGMLGILGGNAWFGWLQDPIRVARVQQLAVLSEPRYADWPMLADARINAALEVAVAVARRPIEVLDGSDAILARLMEETAPCLLLIAPQALGEQLPEARSVVQLAQWNDRGNRLAVYRVVRQPDTGCFRPLDPPQPRPQPVTD